jgi:hypothetical protein
MVNLKENVIEWITGDDEVTCTFTQRKFITKIRKMMDKQPELVSKFHENKDGSIVCHLPLKALKLYVKRPNERGLDDESEECDDGEDELNELNELTI